eukprot:CAMPEP_0170284414 /NCGR_PEP_ID=MMETSP0116_2-20130129/42245_1 /TAXON_ID=400756 /ORGANISM="Durinskia baltica, Strain CSIRO CS-38" /LENGTH=68 /DNA_ID=CAMNT_0010535793 /DNA_START=99 /DNA_END=302 /DNA_ORIENTATION=+
METCVCAKFAARLALQPADGFLIQAAVGARLIVTECRGHMRYLPQRLSHPSVVTPQCGADAGPMLPPG